jgi:hypothetical protein
MTVTDAAGDRPGGSEKAPAVAAFDDAAIRALVVRLARPTKAGGHVIERAAILAEGSHCGDIEAWILQHGGHPEAPAAARAATGLYAERQTAAGARPGAPAVRYLLPAGALG